MTLTSTLAPSNDPVTILGPDENLVNMMKSMSPCLPTIGFPLQSPCPPCQAAINVSMTRLRLLLSHHARATHTPSSARDNTLQTAPPASSYNISHNRCVLPHLTASRVLLSRHPWHASSHYPPPPPQDRHKIPKMRPTPKIQRLVNAELRNKVEALPNPTASSGIQPFAFPKNQLRADLLKRCIFRHQPAGCAMHQAWSDAGGLH